MPHGNGDDGAGVSGKTGEGGVFSDAGSFGDRSLFNKEKWLPLARDAPFLISNMCCKEMKKSPLRIYQRANKVKPFLGTLAEESRIRRQAWIRHGCNAFEASEPQSTPLSFWTTQDILEYIVRYGKEIASVYGDIVCVDEDGNEYDPHGTFAMGGLRTTGETQTGCIFCMFGAHLEDEPRFIRLKRTHPKQYDYCMRGGQWSDNPYYAPAAPEYDGEWKNWNPEKIWTPGNGGLGMAKVIDIFNEMYPKNRIEY